MQNITLTKHEIITHNHIQHGEMNSHITDDLLAAYNYFSAFTSKSKITISAACTTVYNCLQQLRHGKSVL